jgi:ribonuclease HI
MPQTNQRAELTAILRALQVVPLETPVRIFSDSKYAINCVTDWAINWRQNGWRTADGPVKNRDIVQAVLERVDERTAKGGVTQYTWVKGHASDVGNVAADALAVRGAKGG